MFPHVKRTCSVPRATPLNYFDALFRRTVRFSVMRTMHFSKGKTEQLRHFYKNKVWRAGILDFFLSLVLNGVIYKPKVFINCI